MKTFIQSFLPFISSLFNKGYKILKQYVIPSILFIEEVKNILTTLYNNKEFWADKEKVLNSFAQRLEKYAVNLKVLIDAFMETVIEVVPEINTGKPITFVDQLKLFIKHIKGLSNVQRGWIFFKVASLMALSMSKDKYNFKEHQADFMTQLCYTKYKINGKI